MSMFPELHDVISALTGIEKSNLYVTGAGAGSVQMGDKVAKLPKTQVAVTFEGLATKEAMAVVIHIYQYREAIRAARDE